MEKLREVLALCIRHQNILGYSTVSLLTAATEHIFSSVVFKCPCNSENMLYGSSFILVPAFILLLLGYMVNTRIWHLLTGGCSPEKCLQCSPWGSCACFCQVLVAVTAKALVAPLTWIAVALLGSKFYECAASGSSLTRHLFCKDKASETCQKQLFKIPCNETSSSERLILQAHSQLIGWFLIAGIMTLLLISTCVNRCCSPVSFLQLRFWKIYSKEEQKLFETKAKEHATKLAERNTDCFFEATDPAPFHTPSKEDWQKISFLYTFNSQEQYYSMIHKYASNNRGNSTKFKGKGQESVFVDEAQAGESGF